MRFGYVFFLSLILYQSGGAQGAFDVIPLGVKGGSDESNLSAYAVAVSGTQRYVCLDAGTIHAGAQRAIDLGLWKNSPTEAIRKNIKGYLISHPHLDHVAGLILNSPDDTSKIIYGLPFCLDVLKEKYFTWKNWANFTNEGEKPFLNKYRYNALHPGVETPLEQTAMTVKAFYLSHSNPGKSTAFLIGHNDAYLLYLGDTGADEIEKSDYLDQLWREVKPLVVSKMLKAIFIEVSFPNEQPEALLFGHLTPTLLMREMHKLNLLTNEKLKKFPIVITHMKPFGDAEERIKQQLKLCNDLDLELIFASQGKILHF